MEKDCESVKGQLQNAKCPQWAKAFLGLRLPFFFFSSRWTSAISKMGGRCELLCDRCSGMVS